MSLTTTRSPRPEVLGKIGEDPMLDLPAAPVEHEQAATVPRLRRMLGDQPGWQIVVEVIGAQQAASSGQSPSPGTECSARSGTARECYDTHAMRPGHSAADLHVHTTASDGTASPTEVLEWASEATDLAVVAICDHNTNEGALEAAAIAHRYRVEVVVGQEVESTDGHILGLWTPELVAPGQNAEDTVADDSPPGRARHRGAPFRAALVAPARALPRRGVGLRPRAIRRHRGGQLDAAAPVRQLPCPQVLEEEPLAPVGDGRQRRAHALGGRHEPHVVSRARPPTTCAARSRTERPSDGARPSSRCARCATR